MELTGDLDGRLRALTLDLAEVEDRDLIDAAERLWALEKGLATPRQRLSLAERLPRLQAFARGLAWLRLHDPPRHRRLARAVRRYSRQARLLGAVEGDVPDRYPLVSTARWLLRRGLPVAISAPLALAAAVTWWMPYRLVGAVVERMRLAPDLVATYKLAASLVAFPLFLLLWTGLAGWAGGPAWAVGVLVLAPVLGITVIRWLAVARETVEDVRLFGRAARRRGAAARLILSSSGRSWRRRR